MTLSRGCSIFLRMIASAWRRRRRDAGPTAPGEQLKSDLTTRWYQFCICDIVSMLCTSIHGVRMFTEPVFYRGRHGQESEESKEDRQGSHQEGGKEDFKEKEVVVSATERFSNISVSRWLPLS